MYQYQYPAKKYVRKYTKKYPKTVRKSIRKTTRGVRRHRGGNFLNTLKSWVGKVNNWLKDTKILSTLGSAYGSSGLPYSGQVGIAAQGARALGYGKYKPGRKYIKTSRRVKRGMRGSALYPAGGAVYKWGRR